MHKTLITSTLHSL